MEFSYAGFISAALDTGEKILIFRPEVSIRVIGTDVVRVYDALVDTGADNIIFPLSIARELKIATKIALGPSATTFGGEQIPLTYADIPLELSQNEVALRWLARVYFFDFPEGQPETLVVGHEGFLNFFTAIFDGEQTLLNLEPNPDFQPL
ncbi:MAG: hypothetical protein WD669_03760 [Pirellulales bacterium]